MRVPLYNSRQTHNKVIILHPEGVALSLNGCVSNTAWVLHLHMHGVTVMLYLHMHGVTVTLYGCYIILHMYGCLSTPQGELGVRGS